MTTPRHRRVAAGAASMALVGGVFSLLIWGKLRLVGPVPRSAYAEPAPKEAKAPERDEVVAPETTAPTTEAASEPRGN